MPKILQRVGNKTIFIMKTFKLIMVAFWALAIVSCGGKKGGDSFEVSVDNTTIGGKLSSYFTLVDKTYKYKKGIVDEVNVELQCIEPLPENLKAYIAVEVLDEDGNVISARKADAWSFSDYDVLRQASSGQTVTIKIENHENVGEEIPAKIRLSSIVEEDDEINGSNSLTSDENSSDDDVASILDESDDDIISTSSGSEDWDDLLQSYEQYVDKYISYLKKASKGDMTALSEYPALMQKAQEFSDKMKNAQSNMSASQWAKYNKITMKMLEAAQEMNE
jgi:hypothetical protein